MRFFNLLLFIGMLSLYSQAQDSWSILAENIDPSHYYGVTMANGVVGLVSSPEPLKVKDVILNGTYDYYQRGRVSNILKTFNHVNMHLDIDGRRIGSKEIKNYEQTLDMKKAILHTRFDVPEQATVHAQMMSLGHLPYTALHIVEITAKKDILISPATVIEAPSHLIDIRNYFTQVDRPHVLLSLLTSVASSPSGNVKVAASSSFIFSEPHNQEPEIIHEDWDYNLHLAKFHLKLKAGQVYRFAIVSSTISSDQVKDPHNESERLTIFARLEGIENLLKQHERYWENLWKSDIEVKGNPEVTRDIRFALYHLYSFAREGTAFSLSPMGLSGLGYNGHVFWDTELWMFPPLLLLQPGMAKSLLEYRFQRLEAAKQNAFSHGYRGAMFPWESSRDGSEDTPVWALTGPFQHHITGCVGWAFWKYYEVTKDKEWLATRGYPVLKEVADFWASRVDRTGPGRYNINNVIGANEWMENIDNNAFTNGMAATVLRYATQAALTLGKTPDPDWAHVAENIPILHFQDGTTRENETYNGEMIKQADVNLLSYPLNVVQDKMQIKKDLDYYGPRMSPEGPAMGFSILVILQAKLGNMEKANALFANCYKPNEVPPFGVISECAGGSNPYFATGAGGMLQAVLSGFGGLEINENGVIQRNQKGLPAGWKELVIKGVGIDEHNFSITE